MVHPVCVSIFGPWGYLRRDAGKSGCRLCDCASLKAGHKTRGRHSVSVTACLRVTVPPPFTMTVKLYPPNAIAVAGLCQEHKGPSTYDNLTEGEGVDSGKENQVREVA